MSRLDYQIVPVNADDIEDAVKDAKLAGLRAMGYRVVASLGVQHKGKPCLALILEPPLESEAPAPVVIAPPPPAPGIARAYVIAIVGGFILFQVATVVAILVAR